MGSLGSIRLAAHGNQTPITPSNIYFLDNRFHPLATSQKVCDAWQRQSEAQDRWHSAKHWSTPASRRASVRRTWRSSSSAINPSLPALKAVNAGSTSSNWSFWRAPLALTPSRFWRSLKPPRSPTTGFDPFHLSRTRELTSPGVNSLPRGRTVTDINEARHTVAANALGSELLSATPNSRKSVNSERR